MAESLRIRLVRCPRCEKLLPESSSFFIYKCGGCGAILEAKKKAHTSDAKSPSSDPIAGEEVINKPEKYNEVITSVSKQEGSNDGFNAPMENGVSGEADAPLNILSSETDHHTLEHHEKSDETGSGAKGTKSLDENHVSNQIRRVNQDKTNNGFTPDKSSTKRSIGERTPQYRDFDVLAGYRAEKEQSGAVEDWLEGSMRSKSNLTNHHRVSPYEYGAEGSANSAYLSAYGRSKSVMRHMDQNRLHWIKTRGQDKPELFRKFDEPNYQVVRSHNVPRRPRVSDPLISTSDDKMQDFYFPPKCPNDRLDYGESFYPPQMRLSHQFAEWSCDHALVEHSLESNPQDTFTHNPNTYLHCYYKFRHGSRKVANSQMESKSYHQVNPLMIRQSGDNSASIWSLPKRKKRHCHPITGGAPIVVCCKCFEVLKLDSKTRMKKDKWKVRCGSCSTIISFEHRRLIASPVEESASVCANSSHERSATAQESSKASGLKIHGDSDGAQDPSTKSERMAPPKDWPSDTSRYDLRQRLVSIKQDSQSSVQLQDDFTTSKQLPLQDSLSPATPVSPSQEQFHHVSSNINKTEKEVQSIMKSQDHVEIVSRQVPLADVSFTTQEIFEVSFNEYLHKRPPQDPSRNAIKLEAKKGVESYWLSFVKESFKDLAKSTLSFKDRSPKVSINGHPLSDHVVKKAEILAGPILPGNYWYDFQAGFWGVMGQPCLGIVPPFIEAFNYPMQANCGGGNTGVFVNGRELHQKDLDMLVSRGLPTTRNKFYKIESSGGVFDENSGEELAGLGKLAPTVERVNRGFGVQIPKSSNINEEEEFFSFG